MQDKLQKWIRKGLIVPINCIGNKQNWYAFLFNMLGAILDYYERARSARSSFFNLREKSEYERPAVVTLLRGLYLSNHETA